MYIESLENIGLTPNEAKIYSALLELKRGSIWDISTYAGIHRRNAYDAIQRLIFKGLAFQVLPKKFLTYAPVHPEKLQELIEEKQKSLESVLPGLVKKFNRVNVPQSIYVYKGVAGLKNYINLELKVGKSVYGIGSKGSWFDPRIKNFALRAAKKYDALKVQSKIIYDDSVKNYPEVIKAIGKEYKFLPKEFSTESSIDIFGDYVAIYSGISPKQLDDEITIFILKDKSLARDYMKWWEFMWSVLPVGRSNTGRR